MPTDGFDDSGARNCNRIHVKLKTDVIYGHRPLDLRVRWKEDLEATVAIQWSPVGVLDVTGDCCSLGAEPFILIEGSGRWLRHLPGLGLRRARCPKFQAIFCDEFVQLFCTPFHGPFACSAKDLKEPVSCLHHFFLVTIPKNDGEAVGCLIDSLFTTNSILCDLPTVK